MGDAQITGSSSSYARKYALGGLFNLDDNKDPDATNKHGKDTKEQHSSLGNMSEAEATRVATQKGLTTIMGGLDKPLNLPYKDKVIKSVLDITGFIEWNKIVFTGNLDYKKLVSLVSQELQKEKDLAQAGI